MINDKNLENRLNAVKDGIEIPIPEQTLSYVNVENNEIDQQLNIEKKIHNISLKQRILTEIIIFFNTLLVSMLYGYGVKGLLTMNWNFLESMGIGLIISHLISRYIPKFYYWIKSFYS